MCDISMTFLKLESMNLCKKRTWKRKESRNLMRISEAKGTLKQSVKKSIEEGALMSEAELLGKAKENRKKCDPEGKTYSASLLGMKSGITSSHIKR